MTLDMTLWTLLHVLVFVYWLGGDLGAFYSSRFLIKPDVSVEKRMLAAKIVNDVDMAPRTALILALPTGFLLAVRAGWIDAPVYAPWIVWAFSGVWLWIAWQIHEAHGAGAGLLKTLDLGIRNGLAIFLVTFGIAGLVDAAPIAKFVAVKMLLLAGAIYMGLLIRRVLLPLGPALAGLTGEAPDIAQHDLAATLKRARPLVMVIWAILILAAFVGLWKPIF